MNENITGDSDFIHRFIREEKYLQNYPLPAEKFKDFCKKRSIEISEKELEYYEKEQLLYPLLRIERPIIETPKIKFKDKEGVPRITTEEYSFQEGEIILERFIERRYYDIPWEITQFENEWLLQLLDSDYIWGAPEKSFQEWSSFKGERLQNGSQKILTYYSSYHIYWLQELKKWFTLKTNIAHGVPMQKVIDNYTKFIEDIKPSLISKRNYYDKFIKFMLSIQNVYYQYAQSDSKGTSRGIFHDKKWIELRKKMNLKNELDYLGLSIEDIAGWYQSLARKLEEIFGIKRDDWIQLWKNISWSKKDNLQGSNRLGIEYLGWALMLKQVIEDYVHHEIMDVDEAADPISHQDILKFDAPKMNQDAFLTRIMRNKRFYDPDNQKSHYHDIYKRLYYLANDFLIDYQPKIMLFVEGKTEETILPEIFKWYGFRPEHAGIEIINYEGVNKLISTSESLRQLRELLDTIGREDRIALTSKPNREKLNDLITDLGKVDIILSNWSSFLTYNLEKWQIFPFFIADNEGKICQLLENDFFFKFDCTPYNIPKRLKYVWGINNDNKPFTGKDFELANYSSREIAEVLSKFLNCTITESQIQELRNNNEGINKIHADVEKQKKAINKQLFDNLIEKYHQTKDESLIQRPFFKLVHDLLQWAVTIHQPSNTEIELEYRKQIKKMLSEE
ncbi:MAG: hypothetical protein A2Y62_10395 [Candidatus Fischerbacteria bacterium RBG_13_37_8]|uniref:OLD protein-like TOPRIM domain-containing protein n=1 Tax=Candidatus Fischerbacteria bacterium RBG_13_37_8 TaxID=1817863 RepID=A0A1F5VQG6_9BACT|nr:MAG: hypothetical protein A2Y62_10395 [Candidatus Fischerbacteria bacterium RBG_13_37_8]